MQSNNPVFRRSEAFNGQATGQANAYGNQTYAGNGSSYAGYGDPATWGTGTPGSPTTQGTDRRGPMTIDSVVQASAISFAAVLVAAAATWYPDARDHRRHAQLAALRDLRRDDDRQPRGLRAVDGQLVQAGRQPRPGAGVLRWRRVSRSAPSASSSTPSSATTSSCSAVLGTFGAFVGTLAAYKFFNIKVGAKFRTFVIAAMFGMVGLVGHGARAQHVRQRHRPVRRLRHRHDHRLRRPGARHLHADPRLRHGRAGRSRPASTSASPGGRPSG